MEIWENDTTTTQRHFQLFTMHFKFQFKEDLWHFPFVIQNRTMKIIELVNQFET